MQRRVSVVDIDWSRIKKEKGKCWWLEGKIRSKSEYKNMNVFPQEMTICYMLPHFKQSESIMNCLLRKCLVREINVNETQLDLFHMARPLFLMRSFWSWFVAQYVILKVCRTIITFLYSLASILRCNEAQEIRCNWKYNVTM